LITIVVISIHGSIKENQSASEMEMIPAVGEVAVFLTFSGIYKILSLLQTQKKTHSML